jgi:insulysin
MKNIQYFDLEISSNDTRDIKGFQLGNGIKVVLISDPNINMSSCSIAIGAGFLQDEFPGTAHFLEHLLFMGSEKYPEQNEYHSYIQINGGYDNAFTSDNITCYYLSLETTFLNKGIEMLSWFFRSPLLNPEHIKSEMEIIDSEHQKNILMDNWIMDDIFRNFIKSKSSKYSKFGTGNLKSLKGITQEKIKEFYDIYYTTDNIYVCIVDSKDLNTMTNEYLKHFISIPEKISETKDSERFKKEKLNLIDDNIIIFNSSSEYIFVNYYLILNAVETNLIQYQLINFINYLLGTEYDKSYAYYLKENDIIKNISSNIDYYYDYSVNINIQLLMIDINKNKNKNNLLKSWYYLLEYINSLKNISNEKFIELYNNFRKIKMLGLLYDSNNDAVSVANDVIENMIKGSIDESIVRKYKVPEYVDYIYEEYIQIINSIIIKITTNININNINEKNFIKSKWYESYYIIENITIDKSLDKSLDKEIIYDIDNIIGIKNFIVKKINYNIDYDKKETPKLIYSNVNIKRKIYLLEHNKYNKPISNITVIRKNKLLLDKHNKIIIGIFLGICEKILNYFTDTMSYYKLSFSLSIIDDCIIYNYYGIDYVLLFFMNKIISFINPDNIINNNDTKIIKYFNDIIRDIKESINNFKFNTPYTICSKFLSYLFDNNLLPEEKLNYINKLSFEKFKAILNDCLKYSDEYYVLTGIKKNGHDNMIYENNDYNFLNDVWIIGIIDSLSINHKKYLIQETNNNRYEDKIIFKNFNITSFCINPNEINNCIITFWIFKKMSLMENDINQHNYNKSTIKLIIKNKIIGSFVSELLNEPLFDKIRTIDKLGYIVKADNKLFINNNDIYFFIIYLVQSSYSIKRILESINNFNKFIYKDIKNNNDSYLEKFKLLKKSKLLEFEKNFSDFSEEINSYIETIVSKFFIFDLNSLYYEICNSIDFNKDIKPTIINITKSNYHSIILDSKQK